MAIKERDYAEKVEAEAMSITAVTNAELKCVDCAMLIPGNVYQCDVYDGKPFTVLSGGNCSEYIKG